MEPQECKVRLREESGDHICCSGRSLSDQCYQLYSCGQAREAARILITKHGLVLGAQMEPQSGPLVLSLLICIVFTTKNHMLPRQLRRGIFGGARRQTTKEMSCSCFTGGE